MDCFQKHSEQKDDRIKQELQSNNRITKNHCQLIWNGFWYDFRNCIRDNIEKNTHDNSRKDCFYTASPAIVMTDLIPEHCREIRHDCCNRIGWNQNRDQRIVEMIDKIRNDLSCLLAFFGFRAEMIFIACRERVLTGGEDSTENKKNTDYDPADITRHSPNIIIVGFRNFA